MSSRFKESDDQRELKALQLPLSPENWLYAQVRLPLTREEYDRVLEILNAMLPAIVSHQEPTSTEDASASVSLETKEEPMCPTHASPTAP